MRGRKNAFLVAGTFPRIDALMLILPRKEGRRGVVVHVQISHSLSSISEERITARAMRLRGLRSCAAAWNLGEV